MKKLNKMFPILKDEQGKSIPCACASCKRMARHIHHKTPRCQGGTDSPENLVALCHKCHQAHHSENGDFPRWGKMGGQITAQRGVSIPNLKQFQGEAGRARWEVYCQKKADAQMGFRPTAAEAYAAFLPGGKFAPLAESDDEPEYSAAFSVWFDDRNDAAYENYRDGG